MHDENLDELMSDLERAGSDSASSYERGGGANAYAREIAEARAAIVAHVREREVELMALAMFAAERPNTIRATMNIWQAGGKAIAEARQNAARALRDAFDQAGGKGTT